MRLPRAALTIAVVAAVAVGAMGWVSNAATDTQEAGQSGASGEPPNGWRTVDYGGARIHVPGGWPVYTDSRCWPPLPDAAELVVMEPPRRAVFLGPREGPDGAPCAETPNTLSPGIRIEPLVGGHLGRARVAREQFGVRITAVGVPPPMLDAILESLQPSGRAQALADLPSSRLAPPRDWVALRVGPFQFSVPPHWERAGWPLCGDPDDETAHVGRPLSASCPPAFFVAPAPRSFVGVPTATPGGFLIDHLGGEVVAIGNVRLLLRTDYDSDHQLSFDLLDGAQVRGQVSIGVGDPEIARRILLSVRRL